MASVQTFYLPHYATYPIYVSLFENVTNASFLRQQLLAGNTAFEYAFLDATMVLSLNHILAATFRALNDFKNSRLRSHNIHSELVFSLSPNNNIAESFRRFGISDTTTSIIAIKISLSPEVTAENVAMHLGQNVKGDSVDFGSEGDVEEGFRRVLKGISDLGAIRKVYKLGSTDGRGGKKGKKGDGMAVANEVNGVSGEASERKELESVVLGIMALKGS